MLRKANKTKRQIIESLNQRVLSEQSTKNNLLDAGMKHGETKKGEIKFIQK